MYNHQTLTHLYFCYTFYNLHAFKEYLTHKLWCGSKQMQSLAQF